MIFFIKIAFNIISDTISENEHYESPTIIELHVQEFPIELKEFQCNLCPNAYIFKEELTAHIKDHFKTYVCTICDKKLIGDTQYQYHLNHTHKNILPQNMTKCENCLKSFTSYTNFEHHQKTCTSEYKIVDCNHCKEKYPKNRMEYHLKSKHLCGKKQAIACQKCGRLFKNEITLKTHLKTHSNKKAFYCDYCGKGFSRKTNLQFHFRIHTGERPFKCEQCPKSFAHVSGLNCHVRVHTGERPYKCPFCEKAYIHYTDLRRHRRSHGGEAKRFSCKVCSREFFEKKFLVSHQKTHIVKSKSKH